VRDGAGNDLGEFVSGPETTFNPIPGDPPEFHPDRSVVVRRADGRYVAYDSATGLVPRHGELFYMQANCAGSAYLRLADITTLTSFYGIPPLEVNSAGAPVRALTVSGAAIVPSGGQSLLSSRYVGDSVCNDFSSFPYTGAEHTVKLAATAVYQPADVSGPLIIAAP
jgi:hypothetical protein